MNKIHKASMKLAKPLVIAWLFILTIFLSFPVYALERAGNVGRGDLEGILRPHSTGPGSPTAPGQTMVQAKDAADGLLGIIALILLLITLGIGFGAFGFVINKIFQRRTSISFKMMCLKPGLSFLTGVIITFIGFGLVAVFQNIPPLVLIVMISYSIGLGLFGIASTARLAAKIVEPAVIGDDLPNLTAHIKGGLVLLAMNAVVILGSIVFVGILLAGVGAALLGYFASIGSSAASITPRTDDETSHLPEE